MRETISYAICSRLIRVLYYVAPEAWANCVAVSNWSTGSGQEAIWLVKVADKAAHWYSPCSLTWCMPVALNPCHRSHRSTRVVFITLKISDTVWLNDNNSHFYSKIKHKSAFIAVDANIRCARSGCNGYKAGKTDFLFRYVACKILLLNYELTFFLVV